MSVKVPESLDNYREIGTLTMWAHYLCLYLHTYAEKRRDGLFTHKVRKVSDDTGMPLETIYTALDDLSRIRYSTTEQPLVVFDAGLIFLPDTAFLYLQKNFTYRKQHLANTLKMFSDFPGADKSQPNQAFVAWQKFFEEMLFEMREDTKFGEHQKKVQAEAKVAAFAPSSFINQTPYQSSPAPPGLLMNLPHTVPRNGVLDEENNDSDEQDDHRT
ncbi:MAG: hypothetical protein JNL32_00060 [Candidatus Kapabacteria bacterium]|nr:hypothetical protein [Candidatus Kapabacteria bacterium]